MRDAYPLKLPDFVIRSIIRSLSERRLVVRKISHGMPYAKSMLEEYEWGFNQAFVVGMSSIPWVIIERRKIERSDEDE